MCPGRPWWRRVQGRGLVGTRRELDQSSERLGERPGGPAGGGQPCAGLHKDLGRRHVLTERDGTSERFGARVARGEQAPVDLSTALQAGRDRPDLDHHLAAVLQLDAEHHGEVAALRKPPRWRTAQVVHAPPPQQGSIDDRRHPRHTAILLCPGAALAARSSNARIDHRHDGPPPRGRSTQRRLTLNRR
jgi:hypothetical protein